MSAVSDVGQLLIKIGPVESCIRLHGLGSERKVVETYFFYYIVNEFGANGRRDIGQGWSVSLSRNENLRMFEHH